MAERWQQWMPFHIDKFRGSPEVQAMHPAARAGYIYLLASMWQTEDCTISCDALDLATESGLGDDLWLQYGARIIRKFESLDGRLRNIVLFEEWSEAKKVYDKRKSGALRTNSVRSPNAERTQCGTQSEELRDTVTGTGTITEEQELPDASHPRPVVSQPDLIEQIQDASQEGIPEADEAELSEGIPRLFAYYCRKLDRSPLKYTLTDARRAKTRSRLRERAKIRGMPEAILEAKQCIDNLAASDYHREHGYIDWIDHIFKSAETFEKRLTWQKPNPNGGSNASGKPTEQQVIDAGQSVLDARRARRMDPEQDHAGRTLQAGEPSAQSGGAGEVLRLTPGTLEFDRQGAV